MIPEPLDLAKLKILPLAERRSLTKADEILVDPDSTSATLLRLYSRPSSTIARGKSAPPASAGPPSC